MSPLRPPPSNPCAAVPASLTALSHLTALVLSRNYLSEAQLPEEAPSLAQLQLLDLSNCELWRVPPILQASGCRFGPSCALPLRSAAASVPAGSCAGCLQLHGMQLSAALE